MDETGRVHVARIYWANELKVHSFTFLFPSLLTLLFCTQQVALEIYSGTQELSIGFFNFDTANHGVIAFAALNAKGSGPEDIAPQLLISTFTGNVQLIEDAQVKWNRDEALTAAVVSEFVELPPPKTIVGDHDDESFAGRVIRHIADLQVSFYSPGAYVILKLT